MNASFHENPAVYTSYSHAMGINTQNAINPYINIFNIAAKITPIVQTDNSYKVKPVIFGTGLILKKRSSGRTDLISLLLVVTNNIYGTFKSIANIAAGLGKAIAHFFPKIFPVFLEIIQVVASGNLFHFILIQLFHNHLHKKFKNPGNPLLSAMVCMRDIFGFCSLDFI